MSLATTAVSSIRLKLMASPQKVNNILLISTSILLQIFKYFTSHYFLFSSDTGLENTLETIDEVNVDKADSSTSKGKFKKMMDRVG